MKQRATILDIIEHGLRGDPERVRGYTELLIQRIQEEKNTPEEEREQDIAALRRVIQRVESGDRGCVMYLSKPKENDSEVENSENKPFTITTSHSLELQNFYRGDQESNVFIHLRNIIASPKFCFLEIEMQSWIVFVEPLPEEGNLRLFRLLRTERGEQKRKSMDFATLFSHGGVPLTNLQMLELMTQDAFRRLEHRVGGIQIRITPQ